MADSPDTAFWALPPKPVYSGDMVFTQNSLPGGKRLPYDSLKAQLLDAFQQSRILPGAPGGPVSNQRFDFQRFSPAWPGGGFPLPGGRQSPGGGANPGNPPAGPAATQPGQYNPGGNPQATGGAPTQPGGGLLNQPAPSAGPQGQGFGPFAPPAAGVGDWRSAVQGLLGGSDPIAAIQKMMGSPAVSRNSQGYNMQGLNSLDMALRGKTNDYTGAQVHNAFGSSGAAAERSADQLGVGDQYRAGGQFGFRSVPGYKSQNVNGQNVIYSLDGKYSNTPGFSFQNGQLVGPNGVVK